jgi:tetratricopeptide (TPR) repeat protein
VAHWRQAAALGHNDAVVYCCLGDAIRDQNPREAAKQYEHAGLLAPNAPEVYADLDFAYTQLGEPAKRVDILERGLAQLPTRDELAQRLGVAYLDAGRYDDAIQCYRTHRFHVSEGQRDLHDNYANALMGRAMGRLAAGQNQEALADLDAALEYPENMGIGRPERSGSATIQYWRGVALSRLGQADTAAKAWREAANPVRPTYYGRRMMNADYGLQTVHTVLALRRLGKDSQADDLAQQALASSRRMEGFDPPNGKVNALILRGYLAAVNGQADEAASLLEQAQATPSRSSGYVRLVRAWMDQAQRGPATQPAAK